MAPSVIRALQFPQQPGLQLIYDTAPIGLAFLSPDCHYVQINQRLTEICGLSVADHIGRSVRDTVPQVADQVEKIVEAVVRTGEAVVGVEVSGQRFDKLNAHHVWITNWHPFKNPDGSIVGVNVFAEEITEPKRAEAVLVANDKALRESEVRFRELADNVSQFAWTADANGWIYWYNKRWHDYTGMKLEDMEGWGWQKVHHPEHVDRVVRRIRESFESGTPWEDTFPLRGAAGSYRWFLSRALPIRNEAGDVIRWFGTNTDVTEQIEAENALRAALQNLQETQNSLIEAEKLAALGRLVAGVAHEINSPVGTSLTVVSELERKSALFVEEIAGGGLKRSSLNDFVTLVQSASSHLASNLNRAAELVESFKQVAIDQSYRDRRIFDLGDLTEQVLTGLRPGLRKNNLVLDVDCQSRVAMNSYPAPYGQALTNLFLNAVTHAFPDRMGGRIDIAVRESGPDNVEIVVADNGCGMSPDIRRQAFNPFFTTRRHEGGIGLGLHIVHNIVTNRLGGLIHLDSHEGEGTTIRIVLPRTASAEPIASNDIPRSLT
jgi:PAS domain S-box-containing protein